MQPPPRTRAHTASRTAGWQSQNLRRQRPFTVETGILPALKCVTTQNSYPVKEIKQIPVIHPLVKVHGVAPVAVKRSHAAGPPSPTFSPSALLGAEGAWNIKSGASTLAARPF